jgi:hypothetical protein
VLPDGSRLHVVIPDITAEHWAVNIRKFVVRANHLDELVVLGTLTAPAASFLAAGELVVAVAERLGHENGTLVLKTYGHLMPDSEDRTRRAVDAAWTLTA